MFQILVCLSQIYYYYYIIYCSQDGTACFTFLMPATYMYLFFQVWSEASSQVFFSYCLAYGCHTAFGSYNDFHHNSHRYLIPYSCAYKHVLLYNVIVNHRLFYSYYDMFSSNEIPPLIDFSITNVILYDTLNLNSSMPLFIIVYVYFYYTYNIFLEM